MTDHMTVRTPTKPSVPGVYAAPIPKHGLDSPHIELLVRLALAGGTLTTLETREVCAAVLGHLEARGPLD